MSSTSPSNVGALDLSTESENLSHTNNADKDKELKDLQSNNFSLKVRVDRLEQVISSTFGKSADQLANEYALQLENNRLKDIIKSHIETIKLKEQELRTANFHINDLNKQDKENKAQIANLGNLVKNLNQMLQASVEDQVDEDKENDSVEARIERFREKGETMRLRINRLIEDNDKLKLKTEILVDENQKYKLRIDELEREVNLTNKLINVEDETSFKSSGDMTGRAIRIIQEMTKKYKKTNDKLSKFDEKIRFLTEENDRLKKELVAVHHETQQIAHKNIQVEFDDEKEKSKIIDEVTNLKLQLSEKEEIIEELKNELKKRTYNLQELVNKELWDKNREIEKFNKLREPKNKKPGLKNSPQEKRNGIYFIPKFLDENSEFKENISSSDDEIKLLKNQLYSCQEEKIYLLKKISEIEENFNPDSSLIKNLRLECDKQKFEIENLKKVRDEAFKASHLLAVRLEELADFLGTLLTNEVGFISRKKREILWQAIEKSREISKSFSFYNLDPNSIDLSIPILPDCSDWSFSGADNEIDDTNPLRPSDTDLEQQQRNQIRTTTPDLIRSESLPKSMTLVKYLNLDTANELVFTSGMGSIDSLPETAATIDSLPYDDDMINSLLDYRGSTDGRCTADSVDYRDFDSIPDTIESIPGTLDSVPDTADSVVEETSEIRRRCPNRHIDFSFHLDPENLSQSDGKTTKPENSRLNSANLEDDGLESERTKSMMSQPHLSTADVNDSESEAWSEPDRNVSAARIGLQNSGRKIITGYRRSRPVTLPQPADTDSSDVQRSGIILINDPGISIISARKSQRQNDVSRIESAHPERNVADGKNSLHTDVVHFRNHYLEKYNDHTKLMRQELEQIFRYIHKSYKNDCDRNLMLKLRKISEEFETLEFCSSKLSNYLHETTSRCETLANMLDETQNDFERVMIDLKSTRLSHNCLVLEHEEKLNQLRQLEKSNSDLRNKLSNAEELENNFRKSYAELKMGLENLRAFKKDHIELQQKLKNAETEAAQLKSTIPDIENLTKELSGCTEKVEKLLLEKEEILTEMEDYKNLTNNQIRKFEEEIKFKDELNQILANKEKSFTEELIPKLKSEIKELETVIEGDNIIMMEKDRVILELKTNFEKISSEEVIHKNQIKQLESNLEILKEKLLNSEKKISVFKEKYETEKCESEKQLNELQNTKIQYENKMKELLAHLMQLRNDEEQKLISQEQLLSRLEELKLKKNRWKKTVNEWKYMYETVLKEKKQLEEKFKNFQNCSFHNSSLSNSILDENLKSPDSRAHKVHHLEKVKMELENRVRELESANKELELNLHELQDVARIQSSDCAVISGDDISSRPPTPPKSKTNNVHCRSALSGSPTSDYHISSSTNSSPVANTRSCRRNLQKWLMPTSSGKDQQPDFTKNQAYTSESDENHNESSRKKLVTGTTAASPDLGIGSDHGRRFSFEENNSGSNQEFNTLEDENLTLKQQLESTRKALKETLHKLTMLNNNKKQMEKAICKQIYKTNNILKKARVNLEDEKITNDHIVQTEV